MRQATTYISSPGPYTPPPVFGIPEPATLRRVREALVADPKGWKRAISGKAFKAQCALDGESLKRPPKGYDPDHPLIEDLKRKDFTASIKFTEKQTCQKDFMKTLAVSYRTMAPFTAYLTHAGRCLVVTTTVLLLTTLMVPSQR